MAVELKKGQKVNLKKKVPIGEILINLNWDQPKKRFLFSPRPIDLDLGCLYELKNGRKGTVQALGNAFGHLDQEPWMALDGDDRTGASAAGENLRINGAKIPEIQRVLVYTFIYEGAADWQTANGVVTLRYPGNEDIIVRMSKKGRRYYGCMGNPECDFMVWQKPSRKKCPRCGSIMLEKGTRLVCADKECGYVEQRNDSPEE